jgi:hypothetical protein
MARQPNTIIPVKRDIAARITNCLFNVSSTAWKDKSEK